MQQVTDNGKLAKRNPLRFLTGIVFICIATGCSTLNQKSSQEWLGLFSAESGTSIAVACDGYGLDRIDTDWLRLSRLKTELQSLNLEMTGMRGRLSAKPDLIEEENAEIELLLLRFINARDSLHDILTYYRSCRADNAEVRARGALLGMTAGLNLSYYDSRFVALFFGQKDILKLINARHSRFEIPGGFYDQMSDSITAPEHLDMLDLS